MLLYSTYAQLVISSAPSIITLNHSLAFHQLIYISMLVSLHTLYMNLAKLIFLLVMYYLHFNNQVFDGHGGKDAAHFVRDNLPRVIVEDADFPLELEKVVKRSFVQTDSKFAETSSHHKGLSSGTTALTAMIFGRYCFTFNSNSLVMVSSTNPYDRRCESDKKN